MVAGDHSRTNLFVMILLSFAINGAHWEYSMRPTRFSAFLICFSFIFEPVDVSLLHKMKRIRWIEVSLLADPYVWLRSQQQQ